MVCLSMSLTGNPHPPSFPMIMPALKFTFTSPLLGGSHICWILSTSTPGWSPSLLWNYGQMWSLGVLASLSIHPSSQIEIGFENANTPTLLLQTQLTDLNLELSRPSPTMSRAEDTHPCHNSSLKSLPYHTSIANGHRKSTWTSNSSTAPHISQHISTVGILVAKALWPMPAPPPSNQIVWSSAVP